MLQRGTAALKSALKKLVPEAILERRRRRKFMAEQDASRNRPLDEVFNEIYERGVWTPEGCNDKFHSGPGSMPEVTKGYEAFVAGYINANPEVSVLVDIGCGDFQVSERILSRVNRPIRYTGCDIASSVIEDNIKRHAKPGQIEFQTLNVATGQLPKGDIVTIREVFQHLSNDTILEALANLRTTFKRAIITEAVPLKPDAPNLDIVSGYRTRDGLNSGVFLEHAPFNLRILDSYRTSASPTDDLRTVVVEL